MAHVFYPSGSRTYIRQVSGSNLYEYYIGTQDGLVFYLTGSNYDTASLTASYAISASYALNGGGSGTGLETGSTYPFTSSWAVSASWAPTVAGSGLETGSTYPFTSSWAIYAANATGTSSVVGLLAQFSSSVVSASYSSEDNTSQGWKIITNKLIFNRPLIPVSWSFKVNITGSYNIYFSSDTGSFDNLGWIEMSKSCTETTNSWYSCSLGTQLPRWYNDAIYITLENTFTESQIRYDQSSYDGTYFSSNYAGFYSERGGGRRTTSAAWASHCFLWFYAYSGLVPYSSSVVSASYAATASYALNSSAVGGTDIVMVQMFI